jgi:hypothetical protein
MGVHLSNVARTNCSSKVNRRVFSLVLLLAHTWLPDRIEAFLWLVQEGVGGDCGVLRGFVDHPRGGHCLGAREDEWQRAAAGVQTRHRL